MAPEHPNQGRLGAMGTRGAGEGPHPRPPLGRGFGQGPTAGASGHGRTGAHCPKNPLVDWVCVYGDTLGGLGPGRVVLGSPPGGVGTAALHPGDQRGGDGRIWSRQAARGGCEPPHLPAASPPCRAVGPCRAPKARGAQEGAAAQPPAQHFRVAVLLLGPPMAVPCPCPAQPLQGLGRVWGQRGSRDGVGGCERGTASATCTACRQRPGHRAQTGTDPSSRGSGTASPIGGSGGCSGG